MLLVPHVKRRGSNGAAEATTTSNHRSLAQVHCSFKVFDQAKLNDSGESDYASATLPQREIALWPWPGHTPLHDMTSSTGKRALRPWELYARI